MLRRYTEQKDVDKWIARILSVPQVGISMAVTSKFLVNNGYLECIIDLLKIVCEVLGTWSECSS